MADTSLNENRISILIWQISNLWQSKIRKLLKKSKITFNEYLILETLYNLQKYQENIVIKQLMNFVPHAGFYENNFYLFAICCFRIFFFNQLQMFFSIFFIFKSSNYYFKFSFVFILFHPGFHPGLPVAGGCRLLDRYHCR